MYRPATLVGAIALASSLATLACSGERAAPTEPDQLRFHAQCNPLCVFSTSITNPAPVTVAHNTNHSTTFFITNTGTISGTTSLSCLGKPPSKITCGTISPPNVTLAPGSEAEVEVDWSAGACCTTTGSLNLTDSHGSGRGTQPVNIQ